MRERTDMRRSIFTHSVPVFVLALLACLALAGCGASDAGNPSTTPTGTVQARDCGHVQSSQAGTGGGNPPVSSALACFWDAYQNCQAATLTYSTFGVDTGDTYTFTLQHQNSGCTLTDAHDHVTAPRPAQHIGTYTCSSLVRQQDGSLVAQSCGQDGNITIPATATPAATLPTAP